MAEVKVKTLIGKVQKLSSNQTIKVRVETKRMHPKYGKVVKTHKSYLVHNPENTEMVVGDMIKIAATRPISKQKSWVYLSKA
jgi:small subunit ribosomal protein S17